MITNSSAARMGDNYEKAGNFPVDQAAEDEKSMAKQQDQLQQMGQTLARQRDEWISARRSSGWDKRVQEDLDQYHARDNNQRPPPP